MFFRRLLPVLAFALACSAATAATVSFNDPNQGQQWYLDALNFGEAWGHILDLPEHGQINVAVVDSGFDTGHVDLQSNLLLNKGINIVNGSDNLDPVNPHGTGTIGLLAATSGNGEGITQAAWTAQAIPVRVSNRPDGAAYTSDLAAGIRYAADQGARVINVSYSGVNLGVLNRAARYAQRRGAVVFMAAGNDGLLHARWRNQKFLVAVGSTDRDGSVSDFSSTGKFVDVVAPGRNIMSLTVNDRTTSWSGTSFASPIAASVASLMLIANPELAPWQVRVILMRTADDIGPAGVDWASGHGQVNAEAAVLAAIRTRGRYHGSVAGAGISLVDNNLGTYNGLRLVDQLQAVTDTTEYGVGAPASPGSTAPEPGTLLLMLAGATAMHGLPVRRWRKTRG